MFFLMFLAPFLVQKKQNHWKQLNQGETVKKQLKKSFWSLLDIFFILTHQPDELPANIKLDLTGPYYHFCL